MSAESPALRAFRRPAVPLLAAYAIGLAATRWLLPASVLVWSLALTAGVVAAIAFAWQRRGDSTALVLALIALLGAARMEQFAAEERDARRLVRQVDPLFPVIVEGRVRAGGDETGGAGPAECLLAGVTVRGQGLDVRLPGFLLLRGAGIERVSVAPGQRVRALVRLTEPQGLRNFGGPDRQRILADQRIYATARVQASGALEVAGQAEGGVVASWRRGLFQVRRGIAEIIQRHVGADASRFALSMLFNDRRQLETSDEEAFRRSGTMHLFAVSGLHVGLLALAAHIVLAPFLQRRRHRWLAVAALLFAYLVVIGFVPSAVRAWVMISVVAAGWSLRREADGLNLLAAALLLILLVRPLMLFQAGLILSAAGVLAIVVFVPLFEHWILGPKWRPETWAGWRAVRANAGLWVLRVFLVGLAIALVILPLQLRWFCHYNLLAPVVNVGAAMLAFVGLGAALTTAAAGAVSAWAGDAAGAVATVAFRTLREGAGLASSAEWAQVYPGQLPAAAVLVYYGVIVSGYYMVRQERPEFRRKSLARFCLHAAAGMVVLMAPSAWRTWGPAPLRVWFLDVGQGDATLVRFPDGRFLLVDAGHAIPDMGRLAVEPALRTAGARPLDFLVASHDDIDHIGGMPHLLGTWPVRQVLAPDDMDTTLGRSLGVPELLAGRALRPVILRAGDVLRGGPQTTAEVLNPVADEPAPDNNRSVVIRLRHGDVTILLMADAEREVEARLVDEKVGRADVLKAGHHGSRTSSTPSFLGMVQPEVAVISCGRGNRYRHPHPMVVHMLEAAGARILRTDRDGAVLLETDGRRLTWRTAR